MFHDRRVDFSYTEKKREATQSGKKSWASLYCLLLTDGTAIVKSYLYYFLLVLNLSPPCAGWMNRFLFAEFILCNNKIILILNVNFKKRNWFLASEISINWDYLNCLAVWDLKSPQAKMCRNIERWHCSHFSFSGHNFSPWHTHPILPLV